ncbi:MAG: hypothetical protein ACPL4C_02925 [Brevinematia bacterium]
MNKVQGYNLIRDGKITEALRFFESSYRSSLDRESECAIKIIKYFLSKIRKMKSLGDYHKIGDALVVEWRELLNWSLHNNCSMVSEILEAFKYHIFSLALKYYQAVIDNISNSKDPITVQDIDLMVKISRCYREVGKLDKAIEILEDVRQFNFYDSTVLSYLADAYFDVGEIDRSKLFFREAFFWNPQGIEIYDMKSMIIKSLVRVVVDNGYRDNEINEWIPIYGVIENLFDVRRELLDEEVQIIMNRISEFEKVYSKDRSMRNILEPRLINSYIWLIDYYFFQVQDYNLAREMGKVLAKFSPNIYNKIKLGVYKWL